jgi:DNA end-binding protein Ku
MAPRASWKGFLRISLVTCPIALYPATSASERISFNRINRKTGQRVRQLNVDGKTGEKVEADDIVKGYEVDKGRYVLIEDEELDAIQVEASKIINVTQFVDQEEVDPVYLDSPYYMAPEGAIPEETFRVIRAAMEETGTAGIGTIVMASRERRVLIAPKERGLSMTTLRTSREVRSVEPYFENIGEAAFDRELLGMAKQLIEARRQPFEPAEFVDRYEEALRGLVQAKMKGEKVISAPVAAPAPVIDLMAALKQSLEKDGGARKPAARGKREKAPVTPIKAPAAAKAPASAKAPAAAKPQARRRKAS